MSFQLRQIKILATDKPEKKYARRSDLHLARKAFHMSGGFAVLFPFLFLGVSPIVMAAGLACALGLILFVERTRNRIGWVNRLMLMGFGHILRDSEVEGMSGIPFYMASCLFAFLVFPKHITVLSILYLAVGDPSSSFFGVLFGRSKLFPNKSLEGTMGGFCLCALVTFVYLSLTHLAGDKLLVLTLLGGFAGSVAELLPLNIDDNFSIPVISGLFMTLVFWSAALPMG